MVNVLLTSAGIAMFELFPAYVKNHAGVNERGIGWIYLVNTLTIVLIQLPVARALQGHRRMPATAALAATWALSWACVPGVAAIASGASAAVLFIVVLTVFAVGECIHGGIWGALVTELADHRLIGRYMAMSALSWTAGFAAGPAIGGFVLALTSVGTSFLVMAGLFVGILELVRRRRLMERYALLWLCAGLVLLGFSIWRHGLELFAKAVGVAYAPSALFIVALGFILLLLLHFSLVISRLADQTKVLAQRVGLLQHELEQARAEIETERMLREPDREHVAS
jgi:MFS family permease